jgi:hypothetical protein
MTRLEGYLPPACRRCDLCEYFEHDETHDQDVRRGWCTLHDKLTAGHDYCPDHKLPRRWGGPA